MDMNLSAHSNAVVIFWDGTGDPDLKHREIAKRYRDKARANREKRPFNIAVLRVDELDAWFMYRYGDSATRDYVLPDDDAGRDDAFLMVCHLAECPIAPRIIREAWLARHCPWMGEEERGHLLARKALKFGADTLARRLGVTYAMRCLLGFRSIGACDMTKDERKAKAKQLRADRARELRRANGIRSRADYRASFTKTAKETKPWETLGIDRATYYRRKRRGLLGATRDTNATRSVAHIKKRSFLSATHRVASRKPHRRKVPSRQARRRLGSASVQAASVGRKDRSGSSPSSVTISPPSRLVVLAPAAHVIAFNATHADRYLCE
jgi:hypothetical protein